MNITSIFFLFILLYRANMQSQWKLAKWSFRFPYVGSKIRICSTPFSYFKIQDLYVLSTLADPTSIFMGIRWIPAPRDMHRKWAQYFRNSPLCFPPAGDSHHTENRGKNQSGKHGPEIWNTLHSSKSQTECSYGYCQRNDATPYAPNLGKMC